MKKWQITGFLAVLIIGFLLISGCTQDNNKYCSDNFPGTYYDPSSKMCEHYPAVDSSSQSKAAVIQSTNHDLKIGDTAIIEYNEFKKAIKVTSFDETKGILLFETKNVGDKAITLGSTAWVVDWGGVRHDPLLSYGRLTDDFYPGESRSTSLNLYQEFQGMREKALAGKLTFYYSLGDQNASWIIKLK